MTGRQRLEAFSELASIRALAAKTGESLRAMIDIDPLTRGRREMFCEACPRDSADIRDAMDLRDFMLEVSDGQS